MSGGSIALSPKTSDAFGKSFERGLLDSVYLLVLRRMFFFIREVQIWCRSIRLALSETGGISRIF